MNRLFNILLVTYMIMCFGCATSPREKRGEAMVENPVMQESELEEQFESEQINAQRLKAFEARAQQKLQDLADYVNILKSPGLDSTFRQQAMNQALALFEAENPENEMIISDFLKSLLDVNTKNSAYTIDSIQIVNPLQATSADRYEGMLSFTDNLASIANAKEIGMVLRKTKKEFGAEHKLVWEVFLSQVQ